MTEWISCKEKRPPIGQEVIFYYDDAVQIGYLVNDDGSDKPRKWQWVSYMESTKTVIEGGVNFWMPLPESPK